jgi:soluble lytic murein transglycosylase-like protein
MHHTAYRPLIEKTSAQRGIDPDIVEAMVLQESQGRAWAWNPEPRYRYFWDVKRQAPFRTLTPAEVASKWPPQDFPALTAERDQEWWAQQASWGLLQVMGAVARERGFTGLYLTELSDPALGLTLGCQHYAAMLRLAKGDPWVAVAMFNAGPGGWKGGQAQIHVGKVKRYYALIAGRAA